MTPLERVSRGENRGEGCRLSWKARGWPRGRLALDSVNLLFGEVPRAPGRLCNAPPQVCSGARRAGRGVLGAAGGLAGPGQVVSREAPVAARSELRAAGRCGGQVRVLDVGWQTPAPSGPSSSGRPAGL